MYNLLVSGGGWAPNRDTIILGCMFEHTSDELTARFKPNGVTDFDSLMRLPALFMPETDHRPYAKDNTSHVGTIFRAMVNRCDALT